VTEEDLKRERGLSFDHDLDLDLTLKNFLSSDDHDHQTKIDQDVVMENTNVVLGESREKKALAQAILDHTSPSDQSTGTGAPGQGADGDREEGKYDMHHGMDPAFADIYDMQTSSLGIDDDDALDLDFSSIDATSANLQRPMKRAKSQVMLKKVHSQDDLLLSVSREQAFRAIKKFIKSSRFSEQERQQMASVFEEPGH